MQGYSQSSSGQSFVDSISYCVSHELVETFSNRDGNGYFTDDGNGCEIGDLCEAAATGGIITVPYSVAGRTWQVENYWSNLDARCIAGPAAWGESIEYDTGGPNAVALDDNGNAVEVHVGTERLFYRVGRVDFANRTIAWGESIEYDTGGPNAVALDDNGNAVEVHVGTERLFYRVGRVDFANQTIAWGESIEYDTGGPNAVALDDNGNAVEVHVGTERLFYRVGRVDFANRTIAWGESIEYDTGGPNAVALDDNGNAVEVHVGTERLFYRVGRVVSP